MSTSKTLVTAGILAGLWALAGCSSMSANQCVATDWRTVGYEDGVSGYSGDRVGQYRKACTKHGISPDLTAYQQGRDQGLLEFCKPLNGFRTGAHGRGYNGVCPDELDGPFLEAYESGRQLYNLRSRVNSAANQINSMRAESDRIDAGLVSVGTQMMNSSLTNGSACAVAHRHQAHGRAQGRNQGAPAATRERSADVPARAR